MSGCCEKDRRAGLSKMGIIVNTGFCIEVAQVFRQRCFFWSDNT
jgi:hypothetical protein